MTRTDFGTAIQRYLLPGLIFQAVVIGGGYGTGRELVEFFLPHGPRNTFLGLFLVGLSWGLILALCFEFARVTQSYDYRSFFRMLLGRAWFLFEILYLLLCAIILAVLYAAAGEIFGTFTPLGPFVGMIVLALLTAALSASRTAALEWLIGSWSVVLYVAYALFAAVILFNYGDRLATDAVGPPPPCSLAFDALRYAGYNLAAMPQVLFSLKHLQGRKESFGAGAVAGALGIAPAALLTLTLLPFYPSVMDEPVPVIAALSHIREPMLTGFFNIALFGTFVQTSVGIVHSFNERIANGASASSAGFTRGKRIGITLAVSALMIAVAANVGIIGLISQGYGAITYGFIAVVVVPMLTLGLRTIVRRS